MPVNKEDLVTINISGTVFKCHKSTLTTFEDSVLASLDQNSDYYDVSTGEYFFDRSPDYFNVILDAYRHGTIHIPRWACGVGFQKELEFWGLSSQYVSPCCWGTLYSAEEDLKTVSTLEKFYKGNTGLELLVGEKISLRNRIWLFLYDPHSCIYAKIWAIFISFVIIVSVMTTAVESLPAVYTETYAKEEMGAVLKMYELLGWQNSTFLNDFAGYKVSSVLEYIDVVCFSILTLDIVLCFIFCPCRIQLLKNWIHIAEILCTISYWYSFGIDMNLARVDLESAILLKIHIVAKYMICLKVVRLLRVANNIPALKIMGLTLYEAKQQLGVMSLIMFILSSFFGMLVFISEMSLEDRKFENVFSAMYWAVITLTTVGYGDYTPVSTAGQVIAGACAVCGILMLAIPIGIVASEFQCFYGFHKFAKKYIYSNTNIYSKNTKTDQQRIYNLRRDSIFNYSKKRLT